MRSETDSIANPDAAHANASLVERATGLPLQGLAANASLEPGCRRWCRFDAPHAVRTPPRNLQACVLHAAASNSNARLLAVQRPDQERSATAVSLTNARSSTLTSSV